LEPIANTPEELVNLFEYRRGKCMITMQKGHPLMKVIRVIILRQNSFKKKQINKLYLIQNMEYLPYKKMTEWSDKHPEFLTNSYNEVTENIVDKSCIHIGVKISEVFNVVYGCFR